jgi:hypothetical protein
VTVNGIQWKDFDAAKERVRIVSPGPKQYVVIASYSPDPGIADPDRP